MDLKKNWNNYYKKLFETKNYFYQSAQTYSMYVEIKQVINQFCSGKLLDLGCGEMTYKYLLRQKVEQYISLDKFPCHKEIDYVCSIDDMPFPEESFDTIFCSQVFEHLPRPWKSMKDVSKILKKDGVFIMSVPHLSYIHGAPNDYYRYTKFGLEELGREADLEIEKIIAAGGLLSFVSTPISILILSIFGNIPIIGKIFFYLNKYFSILITRLDNYFDKNKIYAYNYIAIYRKK